MSRDQRCRALASLIAILLGLLLLLFIAARASAANPPPTAGSYAVPVYSVRCNRTTCSAYVCAGGRATNVCGTIYGRDLRPGRVVHVRIVATRSGYVLRR